MYRTGKPTDWEEMREVNKGYYASFLGDANTPKLIMLMTVEVCEYNKNHWGINFKMIDISCIDLYLNKAVKKNLLQ